MPARMSTHMSAHCSKLVFASPVSLSSHKYVVMAHIVMARSVSSDKYTVVASTVMAYIVMACLVSSGKNTVMAYI